MDANGSMNLIIRAMWTFGRGNGNPNWFWHHRVYGEEYHENEFMECKKSKKWNTTKAPFWSKPFPFSLLLLQGGGSSDHQSLSRSDAVIFYLGEAHALGWGWSSKKSLTSLSKSSRLSISASSIWDSVWLIIDIKFVLIVIINSSHQSHLGSHHHPAFG